MGRVRGVRTTGGGIPAGAVVLATDGDATAGLTGLDLPAVSVGSITVYLAWRERSRRQRRMALNALADPFVNDAAVLTNLVPGNTPPGWHLLAAQVLGPEELDDAVIEWRARRPAALVPARGPRRVPDPGAGARAALPVPAAAGWSRAAPSRPDRLARRPLTSEITKHSSTHGAQEWRGGRVPSSPDSEPRPHEI